MRNLKRALSLALALVMVVSMMVVGVSAVSVDDFSDGAEIVNKEAVSVLTTLNVINGKDDGSYDPTGVVTRAEMAKMICVVLNGGKDPVLGESLTNTYTDTSNHWAKSYIEYCTTLGIVAGKGNGTFDPNGNVTVAEAGKMVLVALGYNAGVEGYTGTNWQINTDVRANALGLYDELDYTVTSADLTRDNAAQLLYNALDVHMVVYDYVITGTADNAITTKPQLNDTEKGTLLWEKFGAVKVEGVAIANEFSNLEGKKVDTDRAPEGVNVGTALDTDRTRIVVTNDDEQKIFAGTNTFKIATGEDVLGKAVWAYVKPASNSNDPLKATVIGSVFVDESNNIVTDASGDTAADVADDNNLELASDVQYAYNYGAMSTTAPAGKDGKTGVVKTLIDTDNDGYVDYVLYKEMRLGKVTLKSEADDGQLVVAVTGNGTTKGNYIAQDKDDVMGFDNVAKDNYVLTAYIGGKLHVQVAETLTGTIEAYKQTEEKTNGVVTGYRNTNITVDGENYTVSRVETYTGTELTPAVNEFDKTILSSEATFYLDENGYLIAFGEVDEAAYKYALVWAAEHTTNKIDSDRVKVTLENGTTATYTLSSSSEIELTNGAVGTSTRETANAKAQVSVNDIQGMVFSYALTSTNEIKLYLSKQGTVEGTLPKFTKGLTSISMNGDADVNFLRPVEVTASPVANTYYSNNSTTFFYVTEDNNGDIDKVNVYNGRNAALTVDGTAGNAVLALNSKGDVGAAVFTGVKVTESAEDHLFVTASNYVSEDWCTVDAYLNGSTEITKDIKAALYEDGEVVNNPVIKDGLYLYKIDSKGNYELTKPAMGTQMYYFDGTVVRVNTGNSTFVMENTDGTTAECRINSDSVVVDNDLSTVIAVTGGSVNVGDKIQVIVNNSDDREVLMLGIMEHGDVSNTTTGPKLDWDGKTKPADATQVYLTGTAANIAKAITDALQKGDVFIDDNLNMANVDAFTIPKGRTLYVTGNVIDANKLTVNGTLMVGADLTSTSANFSNVGVKGDWTVNAITTVNKDAVATVEGDVIVANSQILTVDGKLYAANIKPTDNGATPPVYDSFTLTVSTTGHVEVSGAVNVGATGTINVNGANSLVVTGNITCHTMKVGSGTNAGRVEAANVTANTVNVAVAGSSVTVKEIVANTVNVTNATLKADKVTGNLVLTGSVTVTVPTLVGNLDTSAVTSGTVSAGTSSDSQVGVAGNTIKANVTLNGDVTFTQQTTIASGVTVTINGKVTGANYLVGENNTSKVRFGATATVDVAGSFVYNDASSTAATYVAGLGFTWNTQTQKFVNDFGTIYKVQATNAAGANNQAVYG